MESREITGKEYEDSYIPLGGFILISKDMMPENIGSIVIAEKTREDHSKFTPTGIVVAKSPFTIWEDEYDQYFFDHINVGDRIGFSSTVPIYSPSPPSWQFDGDDRERYVTIHIKDILNVIVDTAEKQKEFLSRFEERYSTGKPEFIGES